MKVDRQLVRSMVRRPYPLRSRPWLGASFSQTGEDRIVAFLCEQMGLDRPSYLDIGAYHPYHLSNTALFHARGGRGINIDPNPESIERFRRARPKDWNLNIGVGAEPGQLTYYRLTVPTLNTFSRESAESAVEEGGGRLRIESTTDVEVRTVAQVLENRPCPDFLSLDVEGMDLEILESIPTWPGRPAVICVETLTYSEHGRGEKISAIPAELARHGYDAFADTYINTIFVLRSAWRR